MLKIYYALEKYDNGRKLKS